MYDRTINPHPQRWTQRSELFAMPEQVSIAIEGIEQPERSTLWTMLRDDLTHLLKRPVTLRPDAPIVLACRNAPDEERLLPAEGYSMHITPQAARVNAHDDAGLFYGAQTLVQLAMIRRGEGIPCGQIHDWPTFANRWYMADMGRAPFSMPLLKRMVRLLARLKYNGLHLHLHENEMNPVRYEGLPLGSENPFAHRLDAYAELIGYAARYHIQIIPELESWGHCGSILQHYPHLYGASRPSGYGHALGIGSASFDLLEQLYDQWIEILPDNSKLHLGLDEANWRLLDDADPAVFNRQTLVQHLHDRVQRVAARHGKRITVLLWGGGVKHADVYVPPNLRDKVIMMPWHYRSGEGVQQQLLRHWIRKTKRFNEQGELRSPFIGGAGSVAMHEFGVVEATSCWTMRGQEYPNCLGMDILNWGSNDVHGRLLPMYHGAAAAWAPNQAQRLLRREMALDISLEEGVGNYTVQMRRWQGCIPDGDPAAIQADRGPEAHLGRYRWGEHHGEPVVPIWMPETPYRGDQDK